MVVTTKASADELAAPLDLLLTSSALGMADRMMPNTAWSRFALSLAKQPSTVASRAASLGRELLSIAEGRSGLAPTKGDKRFADPAWRGNPLLHRAMQAYLATNNTVDQLFSDANLDWRDAERIRFVLDFLTEGLAPSNNPGAEPAGVEGAHRHRWTQRGARVAPLRRRHGIGATGAVDGGARRVHVGQGHRRHPGFGGLPL